MHIAFELGDTEAAGEFADEFIEVVPSGASGHSTTIALGFVLVGLNRTEQFVEVSRRLRANPALDATLVYAAGELDRAADLFSRVSVPDEAYVRLEAARAHAQAGRRGEADAQLRKALAFYRSVGATRYIREAEALLAATA
jgi:hypothetical protein